MRMKKFPLLSALLVLSTILNGQFTYNLRIIDTKMQPMSGVEVTAKNQNTGNELKARSNNNGAVVFTLIEPGTYTLSYLEMIDFAKIQVNEGEMGQNNRTTTYDPQRVFVAKPKADRSGIVFTNMEAQQLRGQTKATKVTLLIKERSEKRIPNLQVDIVDVPNKLKYRGKTSGAGTVAFYLPISSNFEVDIEGIEAIHRIQSPDDKYVELLEEVFYERTKLNETTKGDTILQEQISQKEGTSTHVLFTFNLLDYDDKPLPDEVVTVDAQNSKKVFKGSTNSEGICRFMLPKGTNYLVNLKYDRELFLVETGNRMGFVTATITRRYRGSRNIEKMMAERELDESGFVVNHPQTYVRPLKNPGNYLKKMGNDMEIDFGSSGPIGTPTLAEDEIFMPEGYYSPNFYCLQPITGKWIWGVELGESGCSPAIYHQGILLINTYSCTLYALEAATGKMLWSKWLNGIIFTTPSADGENVYVVYDNGRSNPKNENESHVLTCFDLKTGKMNWIQWIDNEAIACPVVEGNEVHVASHSGSYYVFNKSDGKPLLSSKTIKAISSPSLTKESIFLTAIFNEKEQLVALNRKNLQVQKKYSVPLAPFRVTNDLGPFTQMNFNGSHPVVYKNSHVILTDSVSIAAFDARSEKVLWKKPVKVHPNQIPVVANNKILVANLGGELLSFDIETGNSQTVLHGKGSIDSQPVAQKGYIFSAANGVLSVTKNALILDNTQWNKNAGHNLVWE
jgi:outer membrane protein assembly factor BamB